MNVQLHVFFLDYIDFPTDWPQTNQQWIFVSKSYAKTGHFSHFRVLNYLPWTSFDSLNTAQNVVKCHSFDDRSKYGSNKKKSQRMRGNLITDIFGNGINNIIIIIRAAERCKPNTTIRQRSTSTTLFRAKKWCNYLTITMPRILYLPHKSQVVSTLQIHVRRPDTFDHRLWMAANQFRFLNEINSTS